MNLGYFGIQISVSKNSCNQDSCKKYVFVCIGSQEYTVVGLDSTARCQTHSGSSINFKLAEEKSVAQVKVRYFIENVRYTCVFVCFEYKMQFAAQKSHNFCQKLYYCHILGEYIKYRCITSNTTAQWKKLTMSINHKLPFTLTWYLPYQLYFLYSIVICNLPAGLVDCIVNTFFRVYFTQ